MSARKHITPKTKLNIISLRSVGLSLPAIASEEDVSISTVQRILKANSIAKKKVSSEDIAKKGNDLISNIFDEQAIQMRLSALIKNDLHLSEQLQLKAYQTLEVLNAHDIDSGLLVSRALSSLSNVLVTNSKSTREAMRQISGSDSNENVLLPSLELRLVSDKEIRSKRIEGFMETEDGQA